MAVTRGYYRENGMNIPIYSIEGSFGEIPDGGQLTSMYSEDAARGLVDAVVDLERMNWISASGMGCLLEMYYSGKQNLGNVRFAGASQSIQEVLNAAHIDDVLVLLPDRDVALQSLARPNTADLRRR